MNGLQLFYNGQRRREDGRPRPAQQQDGLFCREEEGRARQQDRRPQLDGAQARGRAEDRLRAAWWRIIKTADSRFVQEQIKIGERMGAAPLPKTAEDLRLWVVNHPSGQYL